MKVASTTLYFIKKRVIVGAILNLSTMEPWRGEPAEKSLAGSADGAGNTGTEVSADNAGIGHADGKAGEETVPAETISVEVILDGVEFPGQLIPIVAERVEATLIFERLPDAHYQTRVTATQSPPVKDDRELPVLTQAFLKQELRRFGFSPEVRF